MLTQNILTNPTFDLTDWSILSYNSTDKILFCQSNQVFRFDKCKGTIMPRSRILRQECQESKFVKNVISATIDAGFVGKLVFKIELTEEGSAVLESQLKTLENCWSYEHKTVFTEGLILARCQKETQNSVQIDLNPFPNNYYDGTNQTELEPDVIFSQI